MENALARLLMKILKNHPEILIPKDGSVLYTAIYKAATREEWVKIWKCAKRSAARELKQIYKAGNTNFNRE